MLKSCIEFKNNQPFISVNDEFFYPLAYTTYFEECGNFSDFISAGYKMFFINVSFTDLQINNITGFSPFITGVFENDQPDYSEFDFYVRKIISECPDAMIFPRINMAMPKKWLNNNPSETVDTQSGVKRESLFSDIYLQDGAEMLKTLVSHIRSADYSDRIVGYQICGGTTQEWIHHDLFGSYSESGLKKFSKWMFNKYGIKDAQLPQRKDFENSIFCELARRYGEFCCEMTANTVEYFSKVLKEHINNEQIVGVFYGYHAFVNDYMWGLHGMRFIIDSPFIDFFSSPCGYDDNRRLGVDWSDMIASESLKQHGKLYFVECDIRTFLTRRMQDSRPGKYPDDIYTIKDKDGNKTVWCGPNTLELSLSAIRKAYAHQLTKGSGIWWFDMWGGWFQDKNIMSELGTMREIAESSKDNKKGNYPSAETVMFIDEKAYLNIPRGNHLCHSVNITRIAMGNTGIPFDLCMVEDADKVLHKYKAAVFTAPVPSECGKYAAELCDNFNIPYIHANKDKSYFTTDELRNFLITSDVHCYNADGCVVYAGNGFLGIHSTADGEITVTLPKKYNVKSLLCKPEYKCKTDKIILNVKKFETLLFSITDDNFY